MEHQAEQTGKYESFAKILSGVKRVMILTHDNPDPDTFAAGLALHEIITRIFKIPVVIAYSGIVGRVENQTMVRLLKIPLKRYATLKKRFYDCVILVDTQYGTGNNPLDFRPKKLVVFDHHPRRKGAEYDYSEFDPDASATALLLLPYLDHFSVQISTRMATAFTYALKTETQNLGRECSKRDERSYNKLFEAASKKTIARIENARHSAVYYKTLHFALGNTLAFDNVLITMCDASPNPEFIPEICEMMLHYEKATWVLAIGHYDKEIFLSIRTTSSRRSAGKLMKRLVKGYGTGGGHTMTAGGRISPAGFDPDVYARVREIIEKRFLKALNRADVRSRCLID